MRWFRIVGIKVEELDVVERAEQVERVFSIVILLSKKGAKKL